jgi:hypothetical protein
LSKLEKWNSKASLRWDSTIELLRKAQEWIHRMTLVRSR